MKKALSLITAFVTLALGTSALAFQFTDGNIVVYRVGSGANVLTNAGSPVFLDEYTTNGSLVQSFMLPTNYFGAYSPLIGSGTAFGSGLITRSVDGRFIMVNGYGATLGQISTSLGSAFANSIPRVTGLVDGQGNTDTTTIQTNSARDKVELRAAVSDDGINIWTSGDGGGIRYQTRGSTSSTAVESEFNNIRQLSIFNNQLYFDINNPSSFTQSVYTCMNNIPNTLPMATNNVTNAVVSAVTAPGPEALLMVKLHAGGTDPLDTLYIADSANSEVAKYSLVSGTWVRDGSIPGVVNAIGLTGVMRPISASQTNVELYISQGGATLTGGDNIARVTDTAGYHVAPTSGDLALIVNGVVNKAFRGIVMAPSTNSDLALPSGAGRLSVGPVLDVFAKAYTGCLDPTETDVYSLANPGTSSVGWTATVDQPWVTLSSNTGTLGSMGSTNVTVTLGNITGLTLPTNSATITFSNTTSFVSETRAVTLFLFPQEVTPATDFIISGQPGGPFSPTNKNYTVFNGSTPITLAVSKTATWLNLSATSVGMGACSSNVISVSVNTNNAKLLAPGNYSDVVSFSNAIAGTLIDTRAVDLTVGGVYFCDDFSTFTQGAALDGQQGWVAPDANPSLQVHDNAAWDPAATTGIDEPYKNIPLTSNNVSFVYAAMVMTVTSAPPVGTASPSRGPVFWTKQGGSGFARDWVSARDTGTGTFVFALRKSSCTPNDVWHFGTTAFNYGSTNRVIVQTDPGGDTFCALYVNPSSSCLTTNNAYLVANNTGCVDPSVGSFSFQSQFGIQTIPSPGYAVYKACITPDCTEAYNDILTFGAPADPFTTWQSQYFGGSGNPAAAANADPDGDGMSNMNEFLAGFNPTNNAAYLHIISIVKTNTSDIKVTYLGASGNSTTVPPSALRTNVLEFTLGTPPNYTNNFLTANQTNILGGGSGLGGVSSFIDTNGATGAARYYRIRVLVP